MKGRHACHAGVAALVLALSSGLAGLHVLHAAAAIVHTEATRQALPTGLASVLRRTLAHRAAASVGTTWSQQAKLTAPDSVFQQQFGNSVTVSGGTAAVGSGNAAYVFVQSGTTWSLQQEITSTDNWFGAPVALSGNTLAIGSFGHNNFTGAVYVYVRSGTIWTQQAMLTAPHGAPYDEFGGALSLSANTLAIGAWGVNSHTGAVYVYVRSSGTWIEEARLMASDSAAGDRFGDPVAYSGNTILAGAADKNNNTGAAYVFVRSGTTWSQQVEFNAPAGMTGDNFGHAVALNGDTALVAMNGGYGSVMVYVRTGSGSTATWTQQANLPVPSGAQSFGLALAFDGATVVVGAGTNWPIGAAYVFVRSGTTWTEQAELTPSDGAGTKDNFGSAVGVSGNTALVGAYLHDGRGEAYVFVRS